MSVLTPQSVDECCQAMAASARVAIVGGGTKPGMQPTTGEFVALSSASLTGVVEYEPSEFTITVHAGTLLAEIDAVLKEQGQYLPFDPLHTGANATVGGAVASGICGAGRVRYGGTRDFVIGVQMVDGRGKAIRGGGKVVKNAAGFDLPKLVVGSCGSFGMLTEITFKVFPRPAGQLTLEATCDNSTDAAARLSRLMQAPVDLDAVEWEADGSMIIRLAGEVESLRPHARRISDLLKLELDEWTVEKANQYWLDCSTLRPFDAQAHLLRLPTNTSELVPLIEMLNAIGASYRISGAGAVAWIGLADDSSFDRFVQQAAEGRMAWHRVRGRRGPAGQTPAGSWPLMTRVKQAFDPDQRLVTIWDEAHWARGTECEVTV